jgi:hypothetical protein
MRKPQQLMCPLRSELPTRKKINCTSDSSEHVPSCCPDLTTPIAAHCPDDFESDADFNESLTKLLGISYNSEIWLDRIINANAEAEMPQVEPRVEAQTQTETQLVNAETQTQTVDENDHLQPNTSAEAEKLTQTMQLANDEPNASVHCPTTNSDHIIGDLQIHTAEAEKSTQYDSSTTCAARRADEADEIEVNLRTETCSSTSGCRR